MAKIAFVQLVVLAAAFMLQCYAVAGFNIYDDYLTMPELDKLKNDEFHQNVRIAINRTQIDDKSSAMEIKDELKRLGEEHIDQSQIYNALRDMDFDYFPEELIAVLKSVLAQIKLELKDELEQKFINNAHKLLNIYVKPSLKPETIFEKYKSKYPSNQFTDEFDELFVAALDLNNKAELESKLKKFDLAHDIFNARKMLDAAKRIEGQAEFDRHHMYQYRDYINLWPPYHVNKWKLKKANKPYSGKIKSLNRPKSLMERKCIPRFLTYMDISNLAALIYGREQLFTDRENQLNEYNRMCQAWFNPKKHEQIENNIKNLLAKKS